MTATPTPPRATIAVDLDRTLVYSSRAAGPLEGIETRWVEDYDGAPLSLITAAAYERLAELSLRHHVVPVTTRTPEQYHRVRLAGDFPLAVCANGGILLRQGERDAGWDARVAAELAGVAGVAEVGSRVGAVAQQEWVRTVRRVEELFVYLVAHDRERIPADWLDALALWAAPLGWSVSLQGRKVYVVPDVLDKGAAALRVAAELGGPLLAAGDSLLDRGLLEAAVAAARPAHGELHRLGYRHANLQVTAVSGVRAAEEIVDLLAGHADRLALGTAGAVGTMET